MSNTNDDTPDAREAEAQNQPATIEWRGHTFVVPRDYGEWTVDLLESLEEGKEAGIVRGALGADQWREFKARNPKVNDLNELATLLARALGFGVVGESQASSD